MELSVAIMNVYEGRRGLKSAVIGDEVTKKAGRSIFVPPASWPV